MYLPLLRRPASFMRIPRKITPDGLTDAVIAVRYTPTSIPPEALFGDVYRVLRREGFTYVPPERRAMPNQLEPRYEFFSEAGVLVDVKPGLLWFNGVLPATVIDGLPESGRYIGWEAYRRILTAVLEPLLVEGVLPGYTAVTVRYINILPWKPLAQQLRNAPQLPTPEGIDELPVFEYRLNWPPTPDGFRVRLRLTDKLPGLRSADKGTMFDVEITHQQAGSSFSDLMQALDATHQKQKEVFFGLLSPDFLSTLQPEYDFIP